MLKKCFLAVLFVVCAVSAWAQTKIDPNFHIYILMGQSNMAGRGVITDELLDKGDPRVLMLTRDNQWAVAKHPLHFDKPAAVGVGPGLSFGMKMAEKNPKVRIGLIPCAVGGTAIEKWVPGAYDAATKTHPYDDALLRIKEGMKYGVIKGVIWHQGESNSSVEKSAGYLAKLAELIERVRTETGNNQLPFIAGELGTYRDNYALINTELRKLPVQVPFTAIASSQGFVHKGDSTHFDGPSADKFGERFAEKMIQVQRKLKKKR